MDFRIKQLQSFLTLAELLHYGRSATALHMSQPTMTFQIKSLEETFGSALFARDRQGVRLTAAGEAFREYARTIVETAEAASARLHGLRGRQRLRVSCSPLGQQTMLPRILRTLSVRHPGLELDVRQLTSAQKQAQLKAGQVDALLMVGRVDGARFEAMCERPVVAMVARDSDIGRRGVMAVEELRRVEVIVPRAGDSPGAQEWVGERLGKFGVVPRFVEVAESCPVQLAYVAAGKGVVVGSACASLEQHPEVVAVPFREGVGVREFGVAWMEKNGNPALGVLRGLVQEGVSGRKQVVGAGAGVRVGVA